MSFVTQISVHISCEHVTVTFTDLNNWSLCTEDNCTMRTKSHSLWAHTPRHFPMKYKILNSFLFRPAILDFNLNLNLTRLFKQFHCCVSRVPPAATEACLHRRPRESLKNAFVPTGAFGTWIQIIWKNYRTLVQNRLGVSIFLNSLNGSLYSYTNTLVLISQMFNDAACSRHQ
jgi:hypothetical protein